MVFVSLFTIVGARYVYSCEWVCGWLGGWVVGRYTHCALIIIKKILKSMWSLPVAMSSRTHEWHAHMHIPYNRILHTITSSTICQAKRLSHPVMSLLTMFYSCFTVLHTHTHTIHIRATESSNFCRILSFCMFGMLSLICVPWWYEWCMLYKYDAIFMRISFNFYFQNELWMGFQKPFFCM